MSGCRGPRRRSVLPGCGSRYDGVPYDGVSSSRFSAGAAGCGPGVPVRRWGNTPIATTAARLLVLLLDDYAARALRRPEPPAHPRERVVVAAAAIHEALAACPWTVEVLTADDLMSASALWFVRQMVDGLVECGLSPEQAVHGYRAIWYYTAGEIVVRTTAARRSADGGRATCREQVFGNLDPGELPRLAQVADRWTSLTGEDTYLDGLRALVAGLLAGR